jgi:hypothetical protein
VLNAIEDFISRKYAVEYSMKAKCLKEFQEIHRAAHDRKHDALTPNSRK